MSQTSVNTATGIKGKEEESQELQQTGLPAVVRDYYTSIAVTPDSPEKAVEVVNGDDSDLPTKASSSATLRLDSGLEGNSLRATTTTVVAANCGKVFANPHGTQNEWEKSVDTDSIDVFISHSWRDNRWKKWVTFLFHFNFYAAARSAIASMVILLCLKLVLFNIYPAALDRVAFDVSTNGEVSIGAALFLQQGRDIYPSNVREKRLLFPRNNIDGCAEWNSSNSQNIQEYDILALRLEGCSLKEKLMLLRAYNETADPKLPRLSAIFIYSIEQLWLRKSHFTRVVTQFHNEMIRPQGEYGLPNLTFSPPVFLFNQDVGVKSAFHPFDQHDRKEFSLINEVVKDGKGDEWTKATTRLISEIMMRKKVEAVMTQIPPMVFFLLLFFWHRCRPKTVFVDKLCINQQNEGCILAGIQALPAFLHYSDRLVAFWSETYFTRLWCVYEVARFIATHDISAFDIRPVSLCIFVVGSSLGSWFIISAVDGLIRMERHQMDPQGSICRGAMHIIDEFHTHYWQVLLFMAIIYLVIFLNITFFRDAARAQRLLKRQLQRFSFDDALCTKQEDRAAIEEDLSRWFAEGGAAESRASRAVAIAVLAQVQTREKNQASKSAKDSLKVNISLPWKKKSTMANDTKKENVRPVTVATRSSTAGNSPKGVEHVVSALKQETGFANGVYERLSQDRERRAFELWVRTGVYRDISHYLGFGYILRYRWIIYSTLPACLNLPLTYVIDPYMQGVGLYSLRFVFSAIAVVLCEVPLLYLCMNLLFSSKKLKHFTMWIKKTIFQMDISKNKPAHSFRGDLCSNFLYATFFTVILIAMMMGIMVLFSAADNVEGISVCVLLVMLLSTKVFYQLAAKNDSVYDIGLNMDAVFDAYVKEQPVGEDEENPVPGQKLDDTFAREGP